MVNCDNSYLQVSTKHVRRDLNNFKRLCHEFWLLLIKQTLVASDFEFALVTALAFIAVYPKQDQFWEATGYEEAGDLIDEQGEDKTEMDYRAANDKFKQWINSYLTTKETLNAFVQWYGDTVTVRNVSTTFDKYTAMVWQL
ncbi:hypothetical protein K504DRAFT_500590 [Pleomassaria siparia CBS 279.74]|uniref:Uncharacterized protein n=1 Tax=Pleomassaria siparia CBS 279.74 TaxID=1314801 RepID=A0A6G1KDU9_9PLEO|nr:hypothetical protein K504DRAFT_500590 [Pleomassaria siparia CBS 279.74]